MILFAESRLARVEMQQVFAADPKIYIGGVIMKRGRDQVPRKRRGAPDAETIKMRAEMEADRLSSVYVSSSDGMTDLINASSLEGLSV